MTPIKMTAVGLLALSLAVMALASCSKDSPTEPGAKSTPAVNPVKPNANARIQMQSLIGNQASWSSIYEMRPAGPSGCGFRGWLDGHGVIGGLGASGNVQWYARLPYTLRQVVPLSATCSAPNGMLVVGKHDTDGDGASELGYAWLFTSSGSMAQTELFSSDSSDVWVNGVAVISDSAFVVVGGERTAARANPLVATIALTDDGRLAKRSCLVLTTMSNCMFTDVVLDPAGPSGGALTLIAASSVDIGTNGAIKVHRITVEYPGLTSATLDWSREIAGAGPSCATTDLLISGDRLYVSGDTDDAAKSPPSSGGYWRSGLAARLTFAGDLVWSSVVRLSDRSDRFDFVVPVHDEVYFMGDGASFMKSNTKEILGYGWIAKLAPATGELLANLTFGDDTYASGFNSGFYDGGRMYCGGTTHYEISGESYQGWFCGIDVSGTMASPAPLDSKPAAIGDRIGDFRRARDEVR